MLQRTGPATSEVVQTSGTHREDVRIAINADGDARHEKYEWDVGPPYPKGSESRPDAAGSREEPSEYY